jgi:uncharacterized protein YihD (DUF1040 family)
MRDPDRMAPLLELVAQVWSADPDLRLGQLLVNAARLGGWTNDFDIFSAEDDVFEKGLRSILECHGAADPPIHTYST